MNAVCPHAETITFMELPDEIAGCEDCLATGGTWVHLWMCQSCGHVAYCDSSENRHASAHARNTQHPIARSAEHGEHWSWCCIDDVGFTLGAES